MIRCTSCYFPIDNNGVEDNHLVWHIECKNEYFRHSHFCSWCGYVIQEIEEEEPHHCNGYSYWAENKNIFVKKQEIVKKPEELILLNKDIKQLSFDF